MTETANKIFTEFRACGEYANVSDEELKKVAEMFDGKCVTCLAFRWGKCVHLKSNKSGSTDKFESCEHYMYVG